MVSGISFSGLASGLDTASIIEQLMELERQPIDRLELRIQQQQKTLDLFQQLNTSLAGLMNQASTISDVGTFDVRTATSSNEDLVQATAGTNAAMGTFNVEVVQLARSQSISSTAAWESRSAQIGTGAEILVNGTAVHLEATDTIADVAAKISGAGTGVSASVIQVEPGEYRLSLVSEAAGEAGIRLSELGSDGVLSGILGLTTGSTGTAHTTDGGLSADSACFSSADTPLGSLMGLSTPFSGTITINDGTSHQVSIDLSTDSLETVAQKINDLGGSLSARVIAVQVNGSTKHQLEITGAGPLSFTDDNQVLEALGVFSEAAAQENQAGTDAIVRVNGLEITRNSNTISDAIQGVTLQLTDAEPGEVVTVTIGRDTESVQTQIEDFVAAYNSAREFINKNTRYDAESKTAGALLGDSSVRLIQSRLADIFSRSVPAFPGESLTSLNGGTGVARSSIQIQDGAGNTATIDLSGASTVQDVLDAINGNRTIEVTATVSSSGRGFELVDTSGGSGSLTVSEAGSTTAADLGILGTASDGTLSGSDVGAGGIMSLATIGITTDRQGLLQIDQEKLGDAIRENFSTVQALFTTPDVGVAARAEKILDMVTDPVDGTIKIRTDAIRNVIDDMNDSVDRIEDRLVRVEERLVRQFTAMETMVAQFQELSGFLTAQLAGFSSATGQSGS